MSSLVLLFAFGDELVVVVGGDGVVLGVVGGVVCVCGVALVVVGGVCWSAVVFVVELP